MSLYLKYRPQDFASMVGQNHVVRSIQNALTREAVHHAYLFSGPRGTGKTSLARVVAKAINCKERSAKIEPCNTCAICQDIGTGRLVDLIEIDAASNRGIDEIRELRDKIQFAPSQAKAKVYIIDEVHMLTKEAFNALLKTLEEPPDHAYFVLATTEPHKIPETIVSRCQQFNFQRISMEAIVGRLAEIAKKEDIKADQAALQLIARESSGGLRDAIGLLEQMIIDGRVEYDYMVATLGLTGQKKVEQFFQTLIKSEIREAFRLISEINASGQNLQQFTGELIRYLREQMLLGIENGEDVGTILSFIEIFTEARQVITRSPISQLPLEIAVVKACRGEAKKSPEIKEKEVSAEKRHTEEKTVPENKEKPVPEAENGGLEAIRENWKQVVDRIETPFVRMSFVDSEPVRLEGDTLHLHFNSSSLKDKVANPANQNMILKAFRDVLGLKIKLKLELKKIDLKPVRNEENKKEKEAPTVIQMAEEVFGAQQ